MNPDQDLPPGVEFIKDVYLGLLFLFAAIAIAGFIFQSIKIAGPGLVNFIIGLTVFHGISKKRRWVVPVVLLTSAWGIVSVFLGLLEPSKGLITLIFKVILCSLFFIFNIYCVSVFSKKRTRKYFSAEGKIIF